MKQATSSGPVITEELPEKHKENAKQIRNNHKNC